MPQFSIIVPVYNVAPYLRECLDSVLAQTFTDWECLCVNDGSADESGVILDEYAEKDSRFRVFHKSNGGVSSARNLALDNVRGKWIGFLDGDDVWVPEWLGEIWKEVAQADVDWVHVKKWYDWHDSDQKITTIHPTVTHQVFEKDKSPAFAWEIISRCALPWLNFYQMSRIDGIRFVPGVRFREDALFLYAASTKIANGVLIDCCGYNYRIHQKSATITARHRDDTKNLLSGYLKIWRQLSGTGSGAAQAHKLCDASTFWIKKDVREWFALCPSRTIADGFRVWLLVWRLIAAGACRVFITGTVFDKLRWLIFLGTGYGRILSFTKLSFK